MLPFLQIGSVALRTSGLLLLVGAYLGLNLAERRIPKGGPAPDQLYNLIFIGLIAGILAARLSFALQNFGFFSESPLNLLSLDTSLLDPFGGVAAALISVLIYGQRKKLAFWLTLDTFTPVLAVSTVFLGLAHIASGAAFGAPTSLPWGIDLWGAKRHPSQIYETLAAIAILAVLWRKFGKDGAPGRVFLLFVTVNAGAHLFLEAWRGDSPTILGGVRVAQVVAWTVMALGLWFLERKGLSRQSSNSGNHG
jgi:phosphatidylglycerol---prolipoprotein diacylglyceryl transferase